MGGPPFQSASGLEFPEILIFPSCPSRSPSRTQEAPQAWFPLFCYIRDREAATHHPTPPFGGTLVPLVFWSDGLVQDWGLFPVTDFEVRVLV